MPKKCIFLELSADEGVFSLESLHPRKWCATIKCHTEDNVKEKLETIGVILNESEY